MNILKKTINTTILLVLSLLSMEMYAQNTNSVDQQHIMSQDPMQAKAQAIAHREFNINGRAVNSNIPGLITPDDFPNTCYSYLGLIDFSSRFVTPNFSTSSYATSYPNYWLNGFMNPLIGDLDGDGYPEVVIVSQRSGSGVTSMLQCGVRIFNGRTGQPIVSLNYDNSTSGNAMAFNYSSFHPSPGTHALIKIPGSDNISYIIALPDYANGGTTSVGNNMAGRLVRFDIVPTKNASGKTTSYTWSQKWISDEYWPQTNYNKPVLNIFPAKTATSAGENVPVALVYNKIYDLIDGSRLAELGNMIGGDNGAYARDAEIGFNFVYDMDLDGKYDVVAGGAIYYDIDLTKSPGTFKTLTLTAVPDGRTAVADINGDGIPDVLVITRSGVTSTTQMRIIAWNPNFKKIDPATGEIVAGSSVPSILADNTYYFNRDGGSGSNSNLFIADIDGVETTIKLGPNTKTVKLPEICFITRPSNSTSNWNAIPKIGSSFPSSLPSGVSNLVGFSFIDSTTAQDGSQGTMKLAFYLEANDRSNNTGFALFDFDNDGVAEICYRDEQTLRIIKPSLSRYIPLNPTVGTDQAKSILLSSQVTSFTGFESPVIADLTGSYSADMVVAGRQGVNQVDQNNSGFSIVSSGTDKFAPALPIWNQYNYDPFKINLDLTIPQGDAPNRLSDEFNFTRILRDNDGNITGVIENYKPYNTSMMQAMRYISYGDTILEVNKVSKSYTNVMEPLIFLLEAYVVNELSTETTKKPEIVSNGTKNYIKFTLGNRPTAQTDIPLNYPMRAYINELGLSNIEKSLTLGDLFTDTSETPFTGTIAPGTEATLYMPINSKYGFYILRVGDNSTATGWSFGVNSQAELDELIAQGMDINAAGYGKSSMATRDCYWGDQTLMASKFALFDDHSTTKAYGSTTMNPWANDYTPDNLNKSTVTIAQQPSYGVATKSADGLTFTYVNTASVPNSIDKFTYSIDYVDETNTTITRTANVYVYVVQSSQGSLSTCYGDTYMINLVPGPTGSKLIWKDSSSTILDPAPTQIVNLTAPVTYNLTPDMSDVSLALPYANATFPSVDITITPIGSSVGEQVTIQWTGKIDDNWSNPNNWTLEDGTAIDYTPNHCVDVIVPNQSSTANKYPVIEVENENNIGKLYLQDRALVKNIQRITYTGAFMELNINSSNTKRWIPYIAPFTLFYTGDLSQDKTGTQINYVYVMKTTSSTGEINNTNAAEPLGASPFAMYFDGTSASLQFPGASSKLSLYRKTNDGSLSISEVDKYALGNRTSGGKFIYDNYQSGSNKDEFEISVTSDKDYVLVQNIFPAYLDLVKFQAGNSGTISTQYYIPSATDKWIKRADYITTDWGLNSTVTFSTLTSTSQVFIPPFTFFYMKKVSASATNIVLKYNANTMTNANVKSADYDF